MAERVNVKSAAGQFWTLETNGHRVEILSATQYALDATVRVFDWDTEGTDAHGAEVRTNWFTNHATLLHGSMAEAQLEAQGENLARTSAAVIAELTDELARTTAQLRNRDRQIVNHGFATRALSEKVAQYVAYVAAAELTIELQGRDLANAQVAYDNLLADWRKLSATLADSQEATGL